MPRQLPTANWKTQMRKGFLDLCILNCLREREFYGYAMVQVLKRAEGATMREGIVYPILARMQDDGLIASEKRRSASGPPRKYYRITAEGMAVLAEMNAHWEQMVAVVRSVSTIDGETEDG